VIERSSPISEIVHQRRQVRGINNVWVSLPPFLVGSAADLDIALHSQESGADGATLQYGPVS